MKFWRDGRNHGFTTRVDTIFGATSVQLAPEHPVAKSFAAGNPVLSAQIDEMLAQQKAAREAGDLGAIEKHGVDTGKFAINPFNGELVPIWVANYILADYGTGAIMSVPAHDERDFEFADKYGLPVRRVIVPTIVTKEPQAASLHRRRRCRAGRIRTVDGMNPALTRSERWPHSPKSMDLARDSYLSLEGLGRQPATVLGHADPDGVLHQRSRWD